MSHLTRPPTFTFITTALTDDQQCPDARVNVGESLGSDSFAAKAFEGKPIPDEMRDVPAEEWISSLWLREDARIEEQSIFMPHYNGCLSLLWAKRDIENRPSEDDRLLPELEGDRFSSHIRTHWPSNK